jgi:hypothetical protein
MIWQDGVAGKPLLAGDVRQLASEVLGEASTKFGRHWWQRLDDADGGIEVGVLRPRRQRAFWSSGPTPRRCRSTAAAVWESA